MFHQNVKPLCKLIVISILHIIMLSGISKAQKAGSTIIPNDINYALIEKLFNEKLNELRTAKNLSALQEDIKLTKAAADHAAYMMENDTLTHFQKSAIKKNPSKRVIYYGGTHDGVGENCLFTFLLKPYQQKNKKEPVLINTYAEAAEAIFQAWKNSPLHYKNMIEPKYDVQGLGFSYNEPENKLFVAQVFGVNPYVYQRNIEPLLSDFGIKPTNTSYCKILKDEHIKGYRMANRIFVDNDSIYLYLQKASVFEKAFSNPNDKIAIDIVFKDQFTCDKNLKLNGSPYYDGLLLEPVSFKQLFKRNRGRPNQLHVAICKFPEQVKGLNYQLNAILIKENCFCSYSYPVNIEANDYNLIDLQPFWDTIQSSLITDTFKLNIKQRVWFERGKAEINATSLLQTQNKLNNLGQFVKAIELNAYSSVEGDEKVNREIQEKRASIIINTLKNYFPKGVKSQVKTAENWNMFYHQIEDTKFDFLKGMDKLKIKSFLKDSMNTELEDMLLMERYSEFNISVEGFYNNFSNADILSLGILKALRMKDFELAHAIQSRIIYKYLAGENVLDNLSGYSFPNDTTLTPFFVNLLAAKSLNPTGEFYYDIQQIKNLFKKYYSNGRIQFNYCVFAINYWATTGDTIVSPQKLLSIVNECASLAPPKAVNSLLLNYYLTAVKYYTRIDDYEKMVQNLENIHKLFSKVKLDESAALKLALYFANYNSIDWVVELLEPFIPTNSNERFIHLYLSAGAAYYQGNYIKVYQDALDKYITLFPSDFKKWIADEYQLLREDIFKERYCAGKN